MRDAELQCRRAATLAHNNPGREAEALALVNRVIANARKPTAEMHHIRGGILGLLKRYSEALAAFDAALALRPDFHLARSCRALMLAELGKPKEAVQEAGAVLLAGYQGGVAN